METPQRRSRERAESEPVLLGTLGSGQKVFDRATSHLHHTPELEQLLPTAFESIHLTDEEAVRATIDFGSAIGTTICVKTTESDEIIFAQRERRRGLTRFVKNREAEPTTSLCVILKKVPTGYIVLTAFTGSTPEAEPWDPNASDAAAEFWKSHALLWGKEKTIPASETTAPSEYWQKMSRTENEPVFTQPMKDIRVRVTRKQ